MMANTGRLRPKGVPFAGVRCCIAVLASPYKHLLNIFTQLGSNKKREIRKSQKGAAVKETEDDQTGRLLSSYLSKLMKMCFLMHYFVNKTQFFF